MYLVVPVVDGDLVSLRFRVADFSADQRGVKVLDNALPFVFLKEMGQPVGLSLRRVERLAV